ncbi:OLD family endonuclease [Bacillus paralicheniformis]|uniref:ATP-dependent nuclease n=1 Tax=Bacillus paralicheniformis TaxID=1648923 RepID=UPI000D9E48F8|nr:AAA family ATPase [Bacillus paralicheniformis]QSF97094.1 OLD family endonuclease [Bacillus paralicheniformis]
MRIKEFSIRNFKSIGHKEACRITFPRVDGKGSSDYITIIGENNIGKSSILEALKLFLPETDISKPDLDMFPFKKEPIEQSGYMEIMITFDDFNQMDREHKFIKPYIYDEKMKIRRVWSKPNLKDSEAPFEVYIPKRYIPEIDMEGTFNKKMFESVSPELYDQYEKYCSEQGITNGNISKAKKEDFIEFIYLNNPKILSEGQPEWRKNPNGFASNIRSIMPKVVYVPAVKLIDDETDTNKNKSAANQIAAALFEHHLNHTQEIDNFRTSLLSLKNIFNGETRHTEILTLEEKISKKLNRLIDVEANVDFDIPEVMEKLYLNSSIYLKHGNLVTKPNQQGNGVQRILILSLLELMAEQLTQNDLNEQVDVKDWRKSFLFLIEEPEIYLHPHLQRKMRDSLIQISKHPLAQVICSSHSENFIDLADRHQGTVVLKKNDFSTEIIQVNEDIYGDDTTVEKRNRMRMLLNFNTATLEAFFAKRVVLVEGDCEVASFFAIKNKLKEIYPEKSLDLERIVKEISIIPCNGKLTQKVYYEVLKYFGTQPFLIHDLDSEDLNEGKNLNILKTIGSEEFRLTHQPNFEKDIFDESWDKDKPWKATQIINNEFHRYQEKLLRFFKFVVGEDNFDNLELDRTQEKTDLHY